MLLHGRRRPLGRGTIPEIADAAARRPLPVLPHDLFAPVEKYPVEIQRTPGDEAYWFGWDSTNHGTAFIRVSRLGDEVIVFRDHRPDRFGKLGATV